MTRTEEQNSCAGYEQIARLTTAMLAAARGAQWEQLIELEAQCKQIFAVLIEHSDPAPRSPALEQRKATLIRQVLADDAEIRKLVEPWLTEIGQWLGSTGRSHRLHAAYSPQH